MKQNKKISREEIILEWLELFPLRQLDFELNEKKLAEIFVPHSENWFTKNFLPKIKSPAQRIHLDDIGTFIWKLCDGTNSIASICKKIQMEFGDRVTQIEERTVLFAQQMYKQNFLKMYSKKEEGS